MFCLMTFMQSASMASLAGHLQNILICFSEFSITEAEAETQAEAAATAAAAKNSRQIQQGFFVADAGRQKMFTRRAKVLCVGFLYVSLGFHVVWHIESSWAKFLSCSVSRLAGR